MEEIQKIILKQLNVLLIKVEGCASFNMILNYNNQLEILCISITVIMCEENTPRESVWRKRLGLAH